ncbi:ribonuclease P protein component [Gilvibacter sp.]|uniref:ribonuclease P protein component n=1 Tax=Gilvibacter sp. TaxID=2729997 RepID=UPI0035BE43B7
MLKFPASERLKSSKQIEALFTEGKSAKSFPLLMRFMPAEVQTHKAAFAVSKRNFKSAVDRNRVKRLMREAYRLEKGQFQKTSARYLILFVYTGKNLPTLNELRLLMVKLLKQLE